MTAKEALNLQPGEVAVKLTKKELAYVLCALINAKEEIETQRMRYIQNNVVANYNDLIAEGMVVQTAELVNLKRAIESGERTIA